MWPEGYEILVGQSDFRIVQFYLFTSNNNTNDELLMETVR